MIQLIVVCFMIAASLLACEPSPPPENLLAESFKASRDELTELVGMMAEDQAKGVSVMVHLDDKHDYYNMPTDPARLQEYRTLMQSVGIYLSGRSDRDSFFVFQSGFGHGTTFRAFVHYEGDGDPGLVVDSLDAHLDLKANQHIYMRLEGEDDWYLYGGMN